MINKKISSEIAVGIILLVAIIIGGVFWLQNKAQAPVTAPVTTQPATVAQTPVTQPAVDETANWKTYTNTKYGFELKTPQDWEVKNEEKVYYDIESTDKIAQKMINFSVQKKNGTVTILTILITPTKNLKLCEDTPFCSPGEYIKQNNEFSFGFSSGLGVGVKENLQDDSAVLESFKFTDSAADETANWQTYTNEKYGFEFKYPSYLKPESTDDSPFAIFLASLSNRKKIGNLENGDIVLQITIAKKAMDLNEQLREMKSIEKDGGAVISRYKEIKIDGFDAIQELDDVKVSDPGCYWSTYIKKGDRYNTIALMSAKCDTITNVENDYNKILSTFKFTK